MIISADETQALLSAYGDAPLLHALLRAVGEAVIALDTQGIICFWGDGVTQLLGYAPGVTRGRPLSQFLNADCVDRCTWAMERARPSMDFTTPLMHQQGATLHVRYDVVPVIASDGVVQGALCLLRSAASAESMDAAAGELPPRGTVYRTQSDVNHQVRNSLAIISSLLEMEILHEAGEEQSRLRISQCRIRSLALSHDLALQSLDNQVDVSALVSGVVEGAMALYRSTGGKFSVECPVPVMISSRRATYLGLAITELAVHLVACAARRQLAAVPKMTIKESAGEMTITIKGSRCNEYDICRHMDTLSQEILVGLVERSLGGQLILTEATPFQAIIRLPSDVA